MPDDNGPVRPDESEGGFSTVVLRHGAGELASPDDSADFQRRFVRLLERRTAIYTMGDSSSVPTHVAIDILRSVCFVLGIDPDDPAVPPELISVDLEAEFRRRLAEIERKLELTARLWQDVCLRMPMIESIALRDTLASIGDFPKHYDFLSMAHETPVSIDYPICHAVPESLLGVDYVNEYLRRLLVEADFLGRCELRSCERVLARSCPDYHGLLINLYEPITTNAIGLAVIGEDPTGLDVTDEARTEIARRLAPLAPGQRIRLVCEAAAGACVSLGIRDEGAVEYLCDLVPELMPRIAVGLSHGELRGVFV